MAEAPSRQVENPTRWGHPRRWWAAAGMFVLGLFVGGILVGLVSGGSAALPAAAPTTAPSSTPAPASGSVQTGGAGATGQVVVNDACLRVLNAAQDVYGAINDLGTAVQDLNAARLDEIIRRLQPLQERLRTSGAACKVQTRLPNGSTISGAPETSASATPTG